MMESLEVTRLLADLGVKELRYHQSLIFPNIKKSKDLFIILPTGYGKSLSFQLTPTLLAQCHPENGAIIIMPLKQLMLDQSRKLKDAGMKALYVKERNDLNLEVMSSYTHLFMSPEFFLGEFKTKLLDSSHDIRSRFLYLFVDESHCVVSWGRASKNAKAFREKFNSIGDARAFLPSIAQRSGIAVVALTATATRVVRDDVIKTLHLSDPVIIQASPEKKNIRYSVVKAKGDTVHDDFLWLTRYILQKKEAKEVVERILIFCRHYKHIGSIHDLLKHHVGDQIAALYHATLPEEFQGEIAARFMDPTSDLKIVICSSSFSMGLDIKQLYNVIHYGVPSSIDQYMQESGRIGRDGTMSQATILYHRHSLVGKHVTDESKAYMKLDQSQCRRKFMLDYYGEQQSSDFEHLHMCCDLCTKQCECTHDYTQALSLTELYYNVTDGDVSSDSDRRDSLEEGSDC